MVSSSTTEQGEPGDYPLRPTSMEKRQILFTVAACAVLVLALLGAFALGRDGDAVAADKDPQVRRITAAGTGEATGTPDVMRFNVGVDLTRSDVASAVSDSDALMKKVLASVRKAGVAKKDVKTQRYAIDPRYDYAGNTERLTGYTVTQRARITVRDIAKAGDVIAAASRSGGNDVRIDGIGFEVSEPDDLLDEARAEAVEQARAHAEVYAKAAGAELGEVIEISESTPSVRNDTMTYDLVETAAARAAPIEPGESELKVNLTVVWSLK